MDFNLFQWLRDSIRRTILLGVSDAMQAIGTPESTDEATEVHPEVAALLSVTEGEPAKVAAKTTRGRRSTNPASRKRLGKSLKELNPTETKKAA